MKIRSHLLIYLVLVTVATAETVYKTMDEEGNIVFSDNLTEGAEVIEIKEIQTISFPETKSFDYTPSKKKQSNAQYTKLYITYPENDATIWNNEGNVSIEIKIEPALHEKDLIVLFMDGKQLSTGTIPQFSLTNIDRGTHAIDVAVKNAKDELLRRSAKIVFHLRRMSKLFPNSPLNPENTPEDSSATLSTTDIPVP